MKEKIDNLYLKKNTYFARLIDVLWALFAFRTVSSDLLFRIADGSVQTIRILNLFELAVVFCSLIIHIYGVIKKKIIFYEELFADITAFLWIVGFVFYQYGDWSIIIGSSSRIVFAVLVWIGLRKFVLLFLEVLKHVRNEMMDAEIKHKISSGASRIILWLAYIPWIVIRFPSAMECDAYYQIEQFLGFREMTGQWPPLSCALMGGVVGFVEKLTGSYDIGAFIFVIIQTAICIEVLCYSLRAMKRLGVNAGFANISVLIYVVSTSYSSYITSIVKDTLFSVMVLLFIILVSEILNGYDKGRYIALGFVGFIMCALRNNGVYLLFICLVGIVCYSLKHSFAEMKKIILSLVVVFVCYEVYTKALLPAVGINNSSVNEAMSIPFQQTARYVVEHSDDITEEEWSVIDNTLGMDGLADAYNPLKSDPVKSRYESQNGSLGPYIKVWAVQFFRHPDTYFAAVFHNAYGFYYPFALDTAAYGVYEKLDQIEYHIPESTKRIKYGLYSYIKTIDEIPVIRLINSCGLMAWITLFMFMYGVRRKNGKYIIVVLASFLSIFICVASPTFASNGSRYALPIIYTVPYLMGIGFFVKKDDTIKQ